MNDIQNNTVKEVDYLDGFQYAGGVLQFFPTAEGYVAATQGTKTDSNGNFVYIFNYVNNYTDHLGNIRLSYTKDPVSGDLEIMEEIEERDSRTPKKKRSQKTKESEQNHTATLASFDLEILNFQNLTRPFGLKHEVFSDIKQMYKLDDEDENLARPAYVYETEYQYKYNGKEWQDELGLNMYNMDMRQYDPAIARWVVMDPVVHHSMSPYNAFDNNPVFWADPSGADAENGGTGVTLAFGVSLDSVMGTSSVDFTSYGDGNGSDSNGDQKNGDPEKKNNSSENSKNRVPIKNSSDNELNDSKNNTEQNCCPDGKPKIEVKLSLSSETKSINFPYFQNNFDKTIYYKSEEGSEKEFLSTGGTIHEKVDGIRVGNTVIKVSDGYKSIVVDKNGNVSITYGDPFTYGYYLWRGGELQSSPGSNWNALFDKK